MPLSTAPLSRIAVAAVLSSLAGSVDAIGFLRLGGLFVSFMSGNSTRLGVSLATGDVARAGAAAGLIASFTMGATLGAVIANRGGRLRRSLVLFAVAALLVVAALLDHRGDGAAATTLMAAAMGLENATFGAPDGKGRINLTFMTGTLVNVGAGFGALLTGGPRWTWLPFLVLWFAFAGGAVAGALAYPRLGLDALYGVGAATALVGLGFLVADRRGSPGRGRDAAANPVN